MRAVFWATATDRGSWGTSLKSPRKGCHRVPERACSSDHLMCTKNIKEKQKKFITLVGAYTGICRRESSGEPSIQGEPSAVILKDSESNHYSDKGFRGD